MSLDDGISAFVGSMYEAVYDADRWRETVDTVMRQTGSRMAVVTSVDLRSGEFEALQLHGSESRAVEIGKCEYRQEMHRFDPTLNWARNHPNSGFCETRSIIPTTEYETHPFISWCKDRFKTERWTFFYTTPLDDLSFGLSLHAPLGVNSPDREQLRLQKLFFENLERAVRLAARPPNFAEDDSALIAVDGSGRILSLSKRAEEILRSSEDIRACEGLLSARSPQIASRLERAICAAVDPARGELPERAIRISRTSSTTDLLVVVSYFPPLLNHLPRPVPTALVRLIEMDSGPEHLGEHSHLFNLSARETEIASALLQGHSIESVATLLGISRNTARNHLQSLFEKTQTNRQSHLIQVLDRLSRQ